MKKMLAIICILILAFSFAAMAFTPPAELEDECVQTCIGGVLMICCPDNGGYDCWFEGPC
jgi:hypothetical protein